MILNWIYAYFSNTLKGDEGEMPKTGKLIDETN